MARRVKKTRIYQEPDFTGSSGYMMVDGGENQPTGKVSLETLGSLIDDNPKNAVFDVTLSSSITSTATYADVKAAYDAGKMLYVRKHTSGTGEIEIFRLVQYNPESDCFEFYCDGDYQLHDWQKPDLVSGYDTTQKKEYLILWETNNRWQFYSERLPELVGKNGIGISSVSEYGITKTAVQLNTTNTPDPTKRYTLECCPDPQDSTKVIYKWVEIGFTSV